MQRKLQRIMLIDDDANTNIYNEIILNQANASEEVVIFQNGKKAIEYLEIVDHKVHLIFLDFNMPIMNGWQFLERYNALKADNKAIKIVVMLTTSINEEDKAKALAFNIVESFISKPLKPAVVAHLISQL